MTTQSTITYVKNIMLIKNKIKNKKQPKKLLKCLIINKAIATCIIKTIKPIKII